VSTYLGHDLVTLMNKQKPVGFFSSFSKPKNVPGGVLLEQGTLLDQ